MNPQPKPQRRAPKAKKPLRRSKPMARSRMKRAGAPRRVTRPGPGSDPGYLAGVRALPCLVGWEGCEGDVVAHHAGPKANDSTAVPLCWKHHQQWHDANGIFKGLRKTERRPWAASAIRVTRKFVATPEMRAKWAGTQTQGESHVLRR